MIYQPLISDPAELIPHRGKMLLLGSVKDYDGISLGAECDITTDSIFYNAALGGVPSWTAFEMMAQSISAFSNFSRSAGNVPASRRKGVLVSVSELKTFVPAFKAGTKVYIRVERDALEQKTAGQSPLAPGIIYVFKGAAFTERLAAEAVLGVLEFDHG